MIIIVLIMMMITLVKRRKNKTELYLNLVQIKKNISN